MNSTSSACGYRWAWGRWVGAGIAVLLLLPLTAAAQSAPSVARPAFRVVRFDENWSVMRHAPAETRYDRLKYLSLSDSGSVYLSIGGQIRTRAEAVDNFLLQDSPERSDGFGLVRTLLHADLGAGPHVRAFVEGKHAVALGRELPGGRRPLDHDEWEVQNAFVDLACCAAPSVVTARIGRQELLLGSQRLVSPLDWSNTRRTFEGFRLLAGIGPLAADAFLTRPVVIESTARNTRDSRTVFAGGSIRPAAPARHFAWDLYGLVLSQDDSTRLWGYEGEHERLTLGGRVTGMLGGAAARYEVEGGWQTGELAGRDVSAWFLATEVSRTFTSIGISPVAALGLDYASGDSDPDDDVIGTFHQLYPLGHAYAGYMDLVGRQNLIEARGVISASPRSGLQTRAAVHHFLRARTADAAYNVGGGILQAPWGSDRAIGSELDLTAALLVAPHGRVELGYGHFRPGEFLRDSPSGAVSSNWVYASTTVTF